MALSNLKQGVQLSHESTRGDNARKVVYIDRRLTIAKDLVNNNMQLQGFVNDAISSYPTWEVAMDTLAAIAAFYAIERPEDNTFCDMTQGGLASNWHNALVSLWQSRQ